MRKPASRPTKEPTTSRPPAPRTALPWVIAGIVVVALSLRAPIIAPTAVIADIQAGTGLSAAGAGLLTGLPVLMFALATPLATLTIRRFGPETTVVLCLAGILAGTIVRSIGPAVVVLAGTAVIGAAMTLGNIAVPVLIRRDVPWRWISAVTGAYSATMNVGSMATLLATAPLAGLAGWRWAIAAWTVVTAAGLAYWLVRRRGAPAVAAPGATTEPAPGTTAEPASTAAPGATAEPAPGTTAEPTPGADAQTPGRATTAPRAVSAGAVGPGATVAAVPAAAERARFRRIVALLVLAFCGQSAAYYATTAWLPLLLSETRGLAPSTSGATASLFQIAAIVGAFGVPLVAARARGWVPAAVIALFWVTLPIGLLAAPGAYVLWASIGGIAQGGGFTVIFSIIARIAHSDADTASASARVQAGGYLAATAAPPLAGWLNTATHGWTAPLVLVLAATIAYSVGALLAARLAERR